MWDDFAGHVLYIANVVTKDIFSTIMYVWGNYWVSVVNYK